MARFGISELGFGLGLELSNEGGWWERGRAPRVQEGINRNIFFVFSGVLELHQADTFNSICACQSHPVSHWESYS